jgi:hypothetical protein
MRVPRAIGRSYLRLAIWTGLALGALTGVCLLGLAISFRANLGRFAGRMMSDADVLDLVHREGQPLVVKILCHKLKHGLFPIDLEEVSFDACTRAGDPEWEYIWYPAEPCLFCALTWDDTLRFSFDPDASPGWELQRDGGVQRLSVPVPSCPETAPATTEIRTQIVAEFDRRIRSATRSDVHRRGKIGYLISVRAYQEARLACAAYKSAYPGDSWPDWVLNLMESCQEDPGWMDTAIEQNLSAQLKPDAFLVYR